MSEATLQTNRLLLKPLTPQTLHEWFETKTLAEVKAFLNVEEAAFQLYKAMYEKGMETFRISHYSFLLIEKESNLVIGECGFHTWNPTHRRAEIFYALRRDAYKQKGFMSEALPLVIRYGFEHMNLHRIAALVAPENKPSLKLLHTQGFVFEGRLREDYVVNGTSESSDCYSLLKHEWTGNNQE